MSSTMWNNIVELWIFCEVIIRFIVFVWLCCSDHPSRMKQGDTKSMITCALGILCPILYLVLMITMEIMNHITSYVVNSGRNQRQQYDWSKNDA